MVDADLAQRLLDALPRGRRDTPSEPAGSGRPDYARSDSRPNEPGRLECRARPLVASAQRAGRDRQTRRPVDSANRPPTRPVYPVRELLGRSYLDMNTAAKHPASKNGP